MVSSDNAAKSKKPLRCRIGLHAYFLDSAMFTSAMVCNRCSEPQDEQAYADLQHERELWSSPQCPKKITDAQLWVKQHLWPGKLYSRIVPSHRSS